jgi:hypothetical protein
VSSAPWLCYKSSPRQAGGLLVDGLRKKVNAVPGIKIFIRPTQTLHLGGRPRKAQF